jgi:hypothetical protein
MTVCVLFFLYNSLSDRAIQQLKKVALPAGPAWERDCGGRIPTTGGSMELKQPGRLLNEICFFP